MTSAGSATPSQDGRAPAEARELPLRLLLAEDEELQRTVLASMLTRAGYTVTAVDNGQDALTEILTGEYSLLVTDRGMPGLDGLQLCRAIRAAELPAYVYTLILTGLDPLKVVEYSIVFSVVILPLTYLPMMLISRDPDVMGHHANGWLANTLGWGYLAIVSMAAIAAIPLLVLTHGGQG